jgi:hypothetical protein
MLVEIPDQLGLARGAARKPDLARSVVLRRADQVGSHVTVDEGDSARGAVGGQRSLDVGLKVPAVGKKRLRCAMTGVPFFEQPRSAGQVGPGKWMNLERSHRRRTIALAVDAEDPDRR